MGWKLHAEPGDAFELGAHPPTYIHVVSEVEEAETKRSITHNLNVIVHRRESHSPPTCFRAHDADDMEGLINRSIVIRIPLLERCDLGSEKTATVDDVRSDDFRNERDNGILRWDLGVVRRIKLRRIIEDSYH